MTHRDSRVGSAGSWILFEIFGGADDPTVIAVGQTAKHFAPVERVIRSRTHRAVVETVLESIRAEEHPSTIDFTQSGTRYIFSPLTDFYGYTSSVLVHYGDADQAPSTPLPCGAWHFNVTRGTAHGSAELLDMYRVPDEKRQSGRPLHEAFERLVGHDHEALQKLVEKTPGVIHQAFETVETDDGYRWIANYSCRFVEHDTGEIILHGVTRQCGPWEPGSSQAPDPLTLTTQVSRQAHVPGYYRIIVDPADGIILRTYDGLPSSAKPGTATLADLLQSAETTEHALQHLRAVARSGLPLDEVVTTSSSGDQVAARIDPVRVGDKVAALVSFWENRIIPPERSL
jgi:hypothetical protein